jgi:hypothetical protein
MGLSRLDNFLKSTKGELLYVDPSSLDSTDSIENTGNSLARPFKTIQRALIEAARFSYQSGSNNDRFGKTTILLYPGEHIVDNRPGWIPIGDQIPNTFRLRSGTTSDNFSAFDLRTNFDLSSPNNALYKLNSINGGVIIPRGTSIVGLDLRKTKILPKYVPNPENDDIESSAIFRVTGACYFWQFSIFDADLNSIAYKDYTTNTFVPNFSHHKLTCFEYADGVNPVVINDEFLNYSSDRTDLDMYYEKVGLVYGSASGRNVFPDYPSSSLDIEPKIDEYQIVGSTGAEVGITSIIAGDGTLTSNLITATLEEVLPSLDVNTPIRVSGVSEPGYDGQFVVFDFISPTQIRYKVSIPPQNPSPTVAGATLNISVDTVSSASPYIFNISLRSVFGMCGMHADGDKATGFKSMVVAQFTGIGLQKDDNAFVKYNANIGLYEDKTASGNENLHTNSRAIHKPSYSNYHIKCSNNGLLQIVSVFAIGFTYHFHTDSGGDASITNSNSNFGAKSLISSGFRKEAFARDDVGYISHIINPKELESEQTSIDCFSIDVGITTSSSAGAGSTSKLYLYNQKNTDVIPETVIDGYRVGARRDDYLHLIISENNESSVYSSKIVMDSPSQNPTETAEKTIRVQRINEINTILNSTITLETNHNFINGESIRIISLDGNLPDGLDSEKIYYVITESISPNPILSPNQIKIAATLNDAVNDVFIIINNRGGVLNIVSRVSDKIAGDIGHPVQYDDFYQNWFIKVNSADNEIYTKILSLGSQTLGEATSRTFIERFPDDRSPEEVLYKFRYVIPRDSTITSRPPVEGFIIQESNNVDGLTNDEVSIYQSFDTEEILNSTELRNFKFISDADWDVDSFQATIRTEIPHNLSVGSQIEISNVISGFNTTGNPKTGFNGEFFVSEILNRKEFKVPLSINPGNFLSDTSDRTQSLPKLKRIKYSSTYVIYKSKEIQPYVKNEQDGIYHLTVINSSNSPSLSPFTEFNFLQPVEKLYPIFDRDNPNSDPLPTSSFALPNPIGKVVVNDPENSLTKETLLKGLNDFNIGYGVSNIISNSSSNATIHTIYTDVEHNLNRLVDVNIVRPGQNYGSGIGITQYLYNAKLIPFENTVTGQNATANIQVSPTGAIENIKIVDGGSAYGIGNSLYVVGVSTQSGHVVGIVSVTKIYDNTGDAISVSNIAKEFDDYNTSYKISSIPIGQTNTIIVSSADPVGSSTTLGIGLDFISKSTTILEGKSHQITNILYDNASGIATVSLSSNHGHQVNDKILIGGIVGDGEIFNRNYIIKEVPLNLNELVIDVGISTLTPLLGGEPTLYPTGFTSKGGNLSNENESLSGRIKSQYGNITSKVIFDVSRTTDQVSIENVQNFDFKIGDYIQIDNEIMRIKRTVTGNPVTVFRGILGTRSVNHRVNSVVRRINPIPIEFRRHSIIRSSGHTFEYLGFGPGNYSTAFPDRQDRQLSASEEVISQSFAYDGGFIVYTGMNSDGDFYISNKRKISTNGDEEIFSSPYPSFKGEEAKIDSNRLGENIIISSEINVDRSIRISGGENKNIISKFDGPVLFNNKITSTSERGIESKNLYFR